MGTTVDPTGLSFTVTKIDGTTESVSPQTLTPTTWGDTVGTQTCTFTYSDGYDSVSCEVEANVQAVPVVFTGISVSGTPATQRANSQIDTTGLTVYANYSDGSQVDVTSDAWFEPDVQGSASDEWGNCISYSVDHWYYPLTEHHLVAGYNYGEGSDDQEYNVNSAPFYLDGEMAPGTSRELVGAEYVTLDVPHLESPVEPWDGDTGGFLIEGASAGTNTYMFFTKAQYDNDTAVDLQTYGAGAALFGTEMTGSQYQPPYQWFVSSSVFRTFSMSVDGTGTANTEGVFVVGTLANAIDPSVGIKKSDFANGYSYYNFKIVEAGP